MKKICGIYKIISPMGRIYIGQSVDIHIRFKRYKHCDCKTQSRLHKSFLKHGVENHTFEIIQECKREELNELEKYYVDLFKTFNSEHGLNLRDGGGNIGQASKETRQKMSKTRKGKKHSIEHIRKISEAKTGKKAAKEAIERMSLAQKGEKHHRFGKTLSDEHKRKIGEANRVSLLGKKQSEETKAKRSENWKGDKNLNFGKKHSPETIAKQVETRARLRQERRSMIF